MINKEKDELRFRLEAPLAGGGKILSGPGASSCEGAIPKPPCGPPFAPVVYPVGYSALMPFNSNDQLDSTTGLFTVNAAYSGQYTIGMSADEYRNGVLLSSTHLQFTVVVADGDKSCKFWTTTAVGAIPVEDDLLKAAPIPAKEEVSLQLSQAATQPLPLHIYNAQGQLQYSGYWPAGETSMKIMTAQWPSGMYYAVVANQTGTTHRRSFIKQ